MTVRTRRPVYAARRFVQTGWAGVELHGGHVVAVDLGNGTHALLDGQTFNVLFEELPDTSPAGGIDHAEYEKAAQALWQWVPGTKIQIVFPLSRPRPARKKKQPVRTYSQLVKRPRRAK